MAQVGERVLAVITSRSIDGLETWETRTPCSSVRRQGGGGALADARAIAQLLVAEGFELHYFHPVAMSFAGSPEAFERVFGLRLIRRVFAGGRGRQVEGFDVDARDAHRLTALPSAFRGLAGAIAIARPPRLIDDAAASLRDVSDDHPSPWSLPDELAISIWADGTSAPSVTGHGIVVAQIGTGHYRHRFFSDRGYRVLPTLLGPGQTEPQRDDHGHSTGEAACLFGAAPDLRLRPVKGLIDPVGDLLMTIDSRPQPDLIINSWGYDADGMDWRELAKADRNLYVYLRLLEAAIDFATASGVVVCAATAKTWKSFPACHPDVIAIGASLRAHARADQGLQASRLYPGRQVPDLWSDAAKSVRTGLDIVSCTQPVQPNAVLCHPGLRDASGDDGFAWCPIEKAASPLAASRLVLLMEHYRGLSPAALKAIATDNSRQIDDGLVPAVPRPAETEADLPADEGIPKLAG